MTGRAAPSKVGLWLLERLGRGYHSDALIGDLIERCASGKGRWWAWKEILMAVFIAQTRRLSSSTGRRIAKTFWLCLTEAAVVLGVIVVADQSRRSPTFDEMITPSFLAVLAILFLVALAGLSSLVNLHRRDSHRMAVRQLTVFILVMTFGVGTLTWAATVHDDQGPAPQHGIHRSATVATVHSH